MATNARPWVAACLSVGVLTVMTSGCALEARDGELGGHHQALVPGVVYVSAGDHYFHTDSDAQNNGASGSPQCDRGTSVDYWHNSEPGTDGCHVGWTQPGEVMRYALGPIVPADGAYDIVLRLGSAYAGKKVRARLVYMGDKGTPTVAQAELVAQARGWGVFSDAVFLSGRELRTGSEYTLEVEHVTGELDFNGFELRPVVPSTRIEAESYFVQRDNTPYDSGNAAACTRHDAVDLEVTFDPKGGSCNVGWGEAGEWLAYYVSPPRSGDYRVVARVASLVGGRFVVEGVHDGATGSVRTSPEVHVSTGGWQSWQDVTLFESVRLIAGPNRPPVWTFRITQSGVNLNYLELVPLRLCDTWSCEGQ